MQQPLEPANGTQFTVSKKSGISVLGHNDLNSANNPNEQEKHFLLEFIERNADNSLLTLWGKRPPESSLVEVRLRLMLNE